MVSIDTQSLMSYEAMYQQGLDRLKAEGRCEKKEIRMLKKACENVSKLEQEERYFAEKEKLGNSSEGWTDAMRIKAEQSLVKRWRSFQLDAVRYGWTPVSRSEMVNCSISTGVAAASASMESADKMELVLQGNEKRMGISQNSSNSKHRKTLMDILEVDRPVRFVDEIDLKIMNQNELK